MFATTGKTIPITYEQVLAAYQKVRQGGKASGVDGQSWEEFDLGKDRHLYLIWNRMSSGSYFPSPVREKEIPKKDGKMRKLGIPTLKDRIAQQVVKTYMEERIDARFHPDSYGYRPLKSAHQALEKVRENCAHYPWVVDMDISRFFDEIDHNLMLKAVVKVLDEAWVLRYIERWLEAPMQREDGVLEPRNGRGTPQGGVISPLLANLYLHFSLDLWLSRNYPQVAFVRYADDVVIHCYSQEQAKQVLEAMEHRLSEVKLRIKPEKTHIVYCKNWKRRQTHETTKFDFLGYSFQPRTRRGNNGLFTAFAGEMSRINRKRIIDQLKLIVHSRKTHVEIEAFTEELNAKMRGWANYYGLFSKDKIRWIAFMTDNRLLKWMRNKYRINTTQAVKRLKLMKKNTPEFFYHWRYT